MSCLLQKDVLLLLRSIHGSFDDQMGSRIAHFVDLVPDRSQLGQPRVLAQDLPQCKHHWTIWQKEGGIAYPAGLCSLPRRVDHDLVSLPLNVARLHKGRHGRDCHEAVRETHKRKAIR